MVKDFSLDYHGLAAVRLPPCWLKYATSMVLQPIASVGIPTLVAAVTKGMKSGNPSSDPCFLIPGSRKMDVVRRQRSRDCGIGLLETTKGIVRKPGSSKRVHRDS